jgi:hypothetical protein
MLRGGVSRPADARREAPFLPGSLSARQAPIEAAANLEALAAAGVTRLIAHLESLSPDTLVHLTTLCGQAAAYLLPVTASLTTQDLSGKVRLLLACGVRGFLATPEGTQPVKEIVRNTTLAECEDELAHVLSQQREQTAN